MLWGGADERNNLIKLTLASQEYSGPNNWIGGQNFLNKDVGQKNILIVKKHEINGMV